MFRSFYTDLVFSTTAVLHSSHCAQGKIDFPNLLNTSECQKIYMTFIHCYSTFLHNHYLQGIPFTAFLVQI